MWENYRVFFVCASFINIVYQSWLLIVQHPILNHVEMILTHWGQEMNISICGLGSIASGNGLLPVRCQVITYTNADLLSIGPLGTKPRWNFYQNRLIFIQKFWSENVFSKWWPICLSLNVLNCATQQQLKDMELSNSGKRLLIWILFATDASLKYLNTSVSISQEIHYGRLPWATKKQQHVN